MILETLTLSIPSGIADDVLSAAIHHAGGCTSWDASGAWRDDDGVVVREPVQVIEASATPDVLARIAVDALAILAAHGESAGYLRGTFGALVIDLARWYVLDAEAYPSDVPEVVRPVLDTVGFGARLDAEARFMSLSWHLWDVRRARELLERDLDDAEAVSNMRQAEAYAEANGVPDALTFPLGLS